MGFRMPSLKPFWERNINGVNWSFVNDGEDWGELGKNNLIIAQNHAILTPALMFVSKIFSQADFYIETIKTGERDYTAPELNLLRNPNYYQTQSDLLEATYFMMLATGMAVYYTKRLIGSEDIEAVYLLNTNLIAYPEEFITPFNRKVDDNPIRNKVIIYDKGGKEEKEIKFKDLLFFYDMPNGLNTKNMFDNKSRITGLKQTLTNTNDSLKAKNIILKTNGKELITGTTKEGGLQLTADEKKKAEKLFNNKFGLGSGRSRALITKADINWQSLHIAARDLGLDESVKTDGNIIYTALHIPKDILSLEAKKTTYNNFKESMVSYIQNEMQSSVNSFCDVWNKGKEDGKRLVGTFENMPVMQFINIEKFDGVKKRGEALNALRSAGLPDDVALELCGFPKDTKLEKYEKPTTQANSEGGETAGD